MRSSASAAACAQAPTTRRCSRRGGRACRRASTSSEWHGLATCPRTTRTRDGRYADPAVVAALRRTLAAADAVLIATPEYNGSIPGALKNALDWASRPFPDNCLRGKPVAVVGASTGMFGAVWAQAELRKVLNTIGAAVLDAALPVPAAHTAFTRTDGFATPRWRRRSDARAVSDGRADAPRD